MNKFNLNQNQNTMIFIEENVLENTVCKMVATLSQPQSVKNAAVCHSGLYDEGVFEWAIYKSVPVVEKKLIIVSVNIIICITFLIPQVAKLG